MADRQLRQHFRPEGPDNLLPFRITQRVGYEVRRQVEHINRAEYQKEYTGG